VFRDLPLRCGVLCAVLGVTCLLPRDACGQGGWLPAEDAGAGEGGGRAPRSLAAWQGIPPGASREVARVSFTPPAPGLMSMMKGLPSAF
jgi:hypothetical protein